MRSWTRSTRRSPTVTRSSYAPTFPMSRRTACGPSSRIRDVVVRKLVPERHDDRVALGPRGDADAARVEAVDRANGAARHRSDPCLRAGTDIRPKVVAGCGDRAPRRCRLRAIDGEADQGRVHDSRAVSRGRAGDPDDGRDGDN